MIDRLKLRDAGLEWVDLGTEIIALDARRDTYMAGNEATKTLWPLLAAGTTKAELVDRLMSIYDIDAAVASVDVDAFVTNLDEKGLLTRA